ncbi:uncharacterized protein N7518_000545 [Penicillium psychrosexuale]|uniref:uncharacterized protein n=1 Tax=Penicillium psychrosexuale TaxID=1002107 RepID=UPI002544EB46|nr:uncharacterized protein N7518_000545 [Penicillium psychrosexuale]KAJ5804242.1 hypothetical protein N7518_000545 [Penicillium psychrosexuale]
MSTSQESLSPTVSSSFSTFAEAKASLEATLEKYQALNREDDADEFLRIVFKYLPLDGQRHLAEDVCGCRNDDELRQLADSLDIGLLRPMMSMGGGTPAITPSPRLGLEDSIENLNALDIESVTRSDQRLLRRNCSKREGYQCIVTECWDREHNHPLAKLTVPCKPFISFLLPLVASEMTMKEEDVNREDNVMMMLSPLHEEFGHFRFVFEASETPNRYRLKMFPNFSSYLTQLLPRNIVTITSRDHHYRLPSPIILAVHAAIGNILHASGRADIFEKLMYDFRDTGCLLAKDGSTNIGGLLSVSRLSVLSSGWNHIQAEDGINKVKRLGAQASLPGTETRNRDQVSGP